MPVVTLPAPPPGPSGIPPACGFQGLLDFSIDESSWDNTVAVTYQSTYNPRGMMDYIPVAKRRAVRGREKSPSRGAYIGYEVNWIFDKGRFALGFTPKPGDTVLECDGSLWTVLTVAKGKHGQTWTLGCVNLVLALGLTDTITIEQSALSLDAAGANIRAWPSGPLVGGKPLYVNLVCRVQPESAAIAEERGITGQQTSYTIFLAQGVTIDDNLRECRVVWKNGTLDLDRLINAERIDELSRLECHAAV